MYAAELLGIFALHGGDVSPALVATNSKCFKKGAFPILTSHNVVSMMRWGKALTLCRCTVDSTSVGGDVFSVTPPNKSDVDYLGQSTKGDLNVKLEHLEAFGIDGHTTLEGPIEKVARTETKEAEGLLKDLGIPVQ